MGRAFALAEFEADATEKPVWPSRFRRQRLTLDVLVERSTVDAISAL
jgi:hypothetical protein